MAVKSSIEWTDATWSPLRVRVKADAAEIAEAKGYTSLVQIAAKMAGHVGPHCEHVSPGCEHCYSGTNNGRCLPANGTGLPFDRRSRDLVDSIVDEKALVLPLKWRAAKRIFVENQSDLFGEWNSDEDIAQAIGIAVICHWHTFQILTKREARMQALFSSEDFRDLVNVFVTEIVMDIVDPLNRRSDDLRATTQDVTDDSCWPLRNIWLGVSCENQETADARIPLLLKTPATIRFISYEPALGPITFRWAQWDNHAPHVRRAVQLPDVTRGGRVIAGCVDHLDGLRMIDWVIVGGESGPGARQFDIAWARQTIEQCKSAGVACFVKQLGARPFAKDFFEEPEWPVHVEDGMLECGHSDTIPLNDRKGGDMSEWPAGLRVREFPA